MAACILILAAWMASLRWRITIQQGGFDPAFILILRNGQVQLIGAWSTPPAGRSPSGIWVEPNGRVELGLSLPPRPQFARGQMDASVPLWIPLFLLAAPILFVWWAGRRHGPGCCSRCGYDLEGNTSGRCPECGTQI